MPSQGRGDPGQLSRPPHGAPYTESTRDMEEKFLSLDPISSASAQGYVLLNLREVEGQEEVLEDKDEEESEVDEKVKEVRENAQLMHATW